jgi:hypothetical protein
LILREFGGDDGVFVRPVGAEGDDLFGGEFAQDGIGGEDDFLVGLAGRAPTGGEVDVDHAAFGAEFLHGGRMIMGENLKVCWRISRAAAVME